MPLDWIYDTETIDWHELSELYRIAPLGVKPAENLKIAFTNSRFTCFVRDQGKLVGVGRALADGIDCSYLCDIAVHPEHQGTGLGKAIVAKLIALSEGHKKIILYANPGKEGFYRQFGFRRMNSAMAIFANPENALRAGLIRED